MPRQSLIGTARNLFAHVWTSSGQEPAPLTADDCVRMALSQSAVIDEAKAKVEAIKGKLAEVESIFYPKLTGIAYIAPMYSVRGNAMDDDSIESSYRVCRISPHTHLQAILAQPLTTFGRAGANERAVEHMIQGKARVRAAEHILALRFANSIMHNFHLAETCTAKRHQGRRPGQATCGQRI